MILPDASLIEIIPPLVVELVGIIFLMATAIKEIPDTRANSIARSFFLIPAMIAAAYLAGTGLEIAGPTILTNNTIVNLNTTEVFTETTSQTQSISIANYPAWSLFHYMMFIILLVFVIRQVLIMVTKSE